MAKGIILAGGVATRLFPVTQVVSKQLLPVFDKPMVYYPLTTLISAGASDILLITNPENQSFFRTLFHDFCELGVKITVVPQAKPQGLAQAITIADEQAFLRNDERFFLILGDNLFHGAEIPDLLRYHAAEANGATVFLANVRDPQRYGVAEFSPDGKNLARIHEKPVQPPSSWAVTGLYCYDWQAPGLVRQQSPSARGELEITDLNNAYLASGQLRHTKLPSSTAWLDTGTAEALLEAAQYVQAIQHRSLSVVGSPEIAALRNNWVTREVLLRRTQGRSDAYSQQIHSLLQN